MYKTKYYYNNKEFQNNCVNRSRHHFRCLVYQVIQVWLWDIGQKSGEGLPIEIEFSESFSITIGSEERSYCRSLYFYGDALWLSMDAIRSHDYGNCKFLTKQK